jgi:hypothetical protein
MCLRLGLPGIEPGAELRTSEESQVCGMGTMSIQYSEWVAGTYVA